MAKIVLGAGSSHTPMLLASDETLPRFQETDQKIKHRDKEGRPTTYAELLEKADPKMAEMVAPAELVARQNKVRAAMARLSKTLNGTGLDALIVMSDDQDEAYLEDARPTFAIYYGDTILNSNEQHEQYRQRFPEWYVKNRQGFFEEQQAARLSGRRQAGAAPDRLADGARFRSGVVEAHARGRRRRPRHGLCAPPAAWTSKNRFRSCRCSSTPISRRTSRGRGAAMSSARPSARRSRPIASDARIGIIASGGLSHFLVDEDFDRAILKACADKDAKFLQTLPRNKLHSGSSEILNWVGVAGAAEHLDLNWFEYVPGYRTPAGTGTGLSFATWA